MRDRSDPVPFLPTLRVREARAIYFEENGFDTSAYTEPTVPLRLFGIDAVLPNLASRKWAVPMHDLHHVATGFGSDVYGEAEVSAFELGGGCRFVYVHLLNATVMLLGLVLAPRRTLRAFALGRRARTLYRLDVSLDTLLDETVGALRARLGLPLEGIADRPRGLHEAAPSRADDQVRARDRAM